VEQIGRYRILKELGRGAMGVVYAAADPVIGRTVAIKTIRMTQAGDEAALEELRRRLRREAQSAGILSHPGIVTIHDVGEVGDDTYIVMEYVEGTTLEAVLKAGVPQPTATLLRILSQAAEALDYAHGNSIVHRDIKPSNIMIRSDGTVKITDFGVAKLTTSTSMTQTGLALGTPNFMSPEQAQGHAIDGRSDQFSLGVVAFRMLAGRLPFDGPTLTAVLSRILWHEPEYQNAELAPSIREILARALAKDPASRFGTCVEFAQELDAAYRAARPHLGEAPAPAAERRAFDEVTTPIVARPAPRPEVLPAHRSTDEVATQLEPPAPRRAPPARLSTDEDATDILAGGRAPQEMTEPPATVPASASAAYEAAETQAFSNPPAPPAYAPTTFEPVLPPEPERRAPSMTLVLVAGGAALLVVALLVGVRLLRRPTPAKPVPAAVAQSAPAPVPPAAEPVPPAPEPVPPASEAALPAPEPVRPAPAEAKAPLRKSAPPPKAPKVETKSKPPAATRETTPRAEPSAAPPEPVPQPAAPPPQKAAGAVVWSGRMQRNSVLVISEGKASFGAVEGRLPGIPVTIEVEPSTVGIREAPGEGNGWKQLMLYSGDQRYSTITIRWRAR
jgi:serine/threonine-protein kinase